MRARSEQLDVLHGLLAEEMIAQLNDYVKGNVKDEHGNRIPAPAAFLAQVNNYLKSNGVDRPNEPERDPSDLLADELPNFKDN